jgi:hypothetical protein
MSGRTFTGIEDPDDIRIVLHVLANYTAPGLQKAEAFCQQQYARLEELDRRYEQDRARALQQCADAEHQLLDEAKAIWNSELDQILTRSEDPRPVPQALAAFLNDRTTRCPNGGAQSCAIENCPGPHFIDSLDDRN